MVEKVGISTCSYKTKAKFTLFPPFEQESTGLTLRLRLRLRFSHFFCARGDIVEKWWKKWGEKWWEKRGKKWWEEWRKVWRKVWWKEWTFSSIIYIRIDWSHRISSRRLRSDIPKLCWHISVNVCYGSNTKTGCCDGGISRAVFTGQLLLGRAFFWFRESYLESKGAQMFY